VTHLRERARAVLAVLVVQADAGHVPVQCDGPARVSHAHQDVLVLAPGGCCEGAGAGWLLLSIIYMYVYTTRLLYIPLFLFPTIASGL